MNLSAGRHRRRAWKGAGSAHIEVRAAHVPGSEALHQRLEDELAKLKGVNWAQVNALTGRVMVALDPEGPSLDELVEVVESVEEIHEVHQHRFSHAKPELPADSEPLVRNLVTLGADVAGLGVATLGLAIRITPIPREIASVVTLAQNERRIHGFLERRLGPTVTDLGLGLTNSVLHAFSENPLNLIADGVHRASLVAEIRSRQKLWEAMEPQMLRRQRGRRLEAFEHEERLTSLPKGPVEKYSDRVSLGSVGAFGLALATTRDPRRSLSALTAGLPKAARLGRESFASQLGRELADRGVLVMDAAVLRKLDRIDTVVFDLDVLMRPDRMLEPMTQALVASARRGGHHLVVAGAASVVGGLATEARVMPGGRRLHETVSELQDEGRGVMLVAGNRHHLAMHVADLCIALIGLDGDVPWGADMIGHTLDDHWFVLEAIATAREASRAAVAIAAAGSGIGAIWAIVGPSRSAARRTSIPVNVSALVAQGAGTVAALGLGRRRPPLPPSDIPWHAMDGDDVLKSLSTSLHGLDRSEAGRREPATPATVTRSPVSRFGRAVLGELANPLTPILGIGVGLSAAVGSIADAALVGGVMATNAMVGGIERVRTEVSLDRLVKMSAAMVNVRREGEWVEVEPVRVVRGDVVEVSAGEVVPADCRILEATGCEVDESSLTGESLPVGKQPMATPGAAVADRACMLFAGSTVVNGSALAVVVATGTATEAGRVLSNAPEPPPSGVEARLRFLTAVTAPATIASGAAVAGISLLRGAALPRAVSSGVSLMVAAVPEGLPLLANVAQLASARRLSRRGALVRNPRTIEALGRVDVLCFDKTGTLTAGTIALQRVSDGATDRTLGELSPGHRAVLAAALRATPEASEEDPLPHATDRAVVEGGTEAGAASADGVGRWNPIGELPFEPARGFHAVIGECDTGTLVAVKGAPETILPRCTSWRSASGVRALGPRTRERLEAEAERMASQGLRILAVAEKRVARQKAGSDIPSMNGASVDLEDDHLRGMELRGFLGLADRVRSTAAGAVADLRRAGVEVVMITGDHPATAQSIGSELGIVNGKGIVTGPEIDAMSDQKLGATLDSVSVFARVTPTHKVRIVGAYQQQGHTVAMTGDGANDAAAVRLAHAGIALGRHASQATVEAADMVVTDDKLETIIDSIIEGRAMWASVRDALAILVGGNLGEVGFTIVATAMAGSSPLGARQLLLVNLLTDMLPAMTIALRPPSKRSPEALLHEGPEESLGGALVKQIALRALATGGATTGAWMFARSTGTARRARTVALAALVGTQLAQTAVMGFRSPLVLASTAASTAAMVGAIQTPVVSQFFGCTPMGPVGWGIALGASVTATGATLVVPGLVTYAKNLVARYPAVT